MDSLKLICPSFISRHLEVGSAVNTRTLALCLAAPHVLYGFIWFFPHIWRSHFRHHSVRVFDCAAWVLKGTLKLLTSKFLALQASIHRSHAVVTHFLSEGCIWTEFGTKAVPLAEGMYYSQYAQRNWGGLIGRMQVPTVPLLHMSSGP